MGLAWTGADELDWMKCRYDYDVEDCDRKDIAASPEGSRATAEVEIHADQSAVGVVYPLNLLLFSMVSNGIGNGGERMLLSRGSGLCRR